MKRRLVAALAAVVLAGVSAVVLINYVSGADQRAMAGVQTTTVYVVNAPVAVGTAADQLGESIGTKAIPQSAIAAGAVTDLSQIAGKVATTDLQPGEQVLTSRFADRAKAPTGAVDVPKGYQQVSIQLDPPRVVGGDLEAGDLVGVFVTVGDSTHLTLHKVLVTRVQGAVSKPPAQTASGTGTGDTTTEAPSGDPSAVTDPIPQGSLMITIAVSAADAEKVVYAAEHAKIYLSLENQQSTDVGTSVVTGKKVLQ